MLPLGSDLYSRGGVVAAVVLAGLALMGCDKPGAAKPPAPAKAELLAHEGELLKLTLTPQAVTRLAILAVPVAAGEVAAHRDYAGEVMAPARSGAGYGRITPTSPMDLASLAKAQIDADAQVSAARARLATARIEAGRAERLFAQDAGSAQERDRAREQLRLAQSGLAAAEAGRAVLGGSVASAADLRTVWIRTPIYAGEVAELARGPVSISDPSGRSDRPSRIGHPVDGAATAAAQTASVDLFFAVDNGDGALRIGQRVVVRAPLRSRVAGLKVPWSAVLHDIHGGEWVYEQVEPTVYVRRRVQVARVVGDTAVLASGPAAGVRVVTQGAAELFGTEFGTK